MGGVYTRERTQPWVSKAERPHDISRHLPRANKMKHMMHESETVALNVARRRSNRVVIALATLMAVGTLAPLAEGQDTSKGA